MRDELCGFKFVVNNTDIPRTGTPTEIAARDRSTNMKRDWCMCLEEPATEQVTDRMTLVFPPSWLDRSDEMKSIVHENDLFKKVKSIIFVNILIIVVDRFYVSHIRSVDTIFYETELL